ncbi:MAG: nuclear transport factor 2 family protein [Melioribacteraceae bacterium]|nr:nuclear transport factor 2 family protein [Melioribacteraceae bacterium]
MGELVLNKTINNLFIYTDNREWKKLKEVFTEKVFVDYTSITGGESSTIHLEELITSWKSLFSGFDSTHHQIGNILIDIYTETSAHTSCYGMLSHFIKECEGGEIWKVYGSYDFHLVKIEGHWKINRLIFNFKFQEGNTVLPKIAANNVKSKNLL